MTNVTTKNNPATKDKCHSLSKHSATLLWSFPTMFISSLSCLFSSAQFFLVVVTINYLLQMNFGKYLIDYYVPTQQFPLDSTRDWYSSHIAYRERWRLIKRKSVTAEFDFSIFLFCFSASHKELVRRRTSCSTLVISIGRNFCLRIKMWKHTSPYFPFSILSIAKN
jgi:hypothetical protein